MKLSKHLVEKPWGRTEIPAEFGEMDGARIGEIWYEMPDRSPSPLLVKWLFTSDKLSIQVHPNDIQAQERGLPSGKEECWYIVHAEPGAVIGMGTKRQLNAEELRSAALSGEIENIMDWRPVKSGDYFYIPAGTVHAIGAGIILVEVQQYADITYRLYDYGRPRELHLDDAVAVSAASHYDDPRSGFAVDNMLLVDGPFFRLWLIGGKDNNVTLPEVGKGWVVPLEGTVSGDGEIAKSGDCMITNNLELLAFSKESRALVATVCQANSEVN